MSEPIRHSSHYAQDDSVRGYEQDRGTRRTLLRWMSATCPLARNYASWQRALRKKKSSLSWNTLWKKEIKDEKNYRTRQPPFQNRGCGR